MADFDPDAYLADPKKTEGFNPKSYLGIEKPAISRLDELGKIVTDIPRQTWEDVKSAGATINETFNPFSEGSQKIMEERVKEAQERPWYDIRPAINDVLTTGKGLAALPMVPGAIISGPGRSVIGHGWSAVTGNPYKPEDVPTEDRGRGVISGIEAADTAMMALAPGRGGLRSVAKSASPVIPPTPPTPGPLGVTLSEGQRTGELPLIQREQGALRGAEGAPAQERAQAFADQQRQQVEAARTKVAEGLDVGRQVIATTPHDAADLILDALTQSRQFRESSLQQRTGQLASAHESFRASLSPTATALAETPVEAAGIVSRTVAQAAEDSRAAIYTAYTKFRELPGQYHPAAFNKIGERMETTLMRGPEPIRIDPQLTPQANSANRELDSILGELRQSRDPDTGRVLPREPITPSLVEYTRRRLNAYYGSALQAARINQNWTDVRATEALIDAFDGHVIDRLRKGTFTGGDPTEVMNALKEARAKHTEYRKTFTPQGAGDSVGQAVQKILGRHEGQAATPEEVTNLLYGKSGSRVGARLIKIFGQSSPEIGAVRQGLFSHIAEPPAGSAPWTPAKIADRIDSFVSGQRSLMDTYFSPREVRVLQDYAKALRTHDISLNAPRSPVDSVIAQITGEGITPSASTQNVVNQLFRKALNGDRYSVEVAERLKSQFGVSSPYFTAYKQGLFRHAIEPGEGLKDWGSGRVAQNLNKLLNVNGKQLAQTVYTPDERTLIQSYADLMRKLEVPQAGANWSNTATFMQSFLHRMSGWLGTVVGAALARGVLPFLPWGVSELIGGAAAVEAQKVVKVLDARKVARQMPLIAEEIRKYQKAVKIYNKANTPLSRAAIGFAGANLNRSLAPLGVKFSDFADNGLQLPGAVTANPNSTEFNASQDNQQNIPRPPGQKKDGGSVDKKNMPMKLNHSVALDVARRVKRTSIKSITS